MRRLFTAEEARRRGVAPEALRWRVRTGQAHVVGRGVHVDGPAPPTALERAVAVAVVTGGVASGAVAGTLLGLDSVVVASPDVSAPPGRSARRPGVRRRHLPPERITTVGGIRGTDATQTLVDLAATLDDLTWEQALESALRRRRSTVDVLATAAEEMRRARTPGGSRLRRVLALRPVDALPTESLLETLMVQLAREVRGLGDPTRQVVIHNRDGDFVARVDLAWPELGLFVELDGEHHRGQPIYDGSRETAIVAATGWLCGRFTWTLVVRYRPQTIRRLAPLVEPARRRPLPAL